MMNYSPLLPALLGAVIGGMVSWRFGGRRGRRGRAGSTPLPAGVRASPQARRYASEHDIDLTRISGSGPDGRITERDVITAEQGAKAPTA